MTTLLKATLPHVHTDICSATTDHLYFVVPPVPAEVVTFPHLRNEQLVIHLCTASAVRRLNGFLGGGLFPNGFFGLGEGDSLLAIFSAADMRDGKGGGSPGGPTLSLMTTLLEAALPHVHTDALSATTDQLYFVVPPVPAEVVTFPHLRTEQLGIHLCTTRNVRRLNWCLGGGLFPDGFFVLGEGDSLLAFFSAADMRNGKGGARPVGPTLSLMTTLLEAALPHVHTDICSATTNQLYFVVPPVPI